MQTGFSLEVFPPKDSVSVNEIYKSLGAFAVLEPDFISVTYGAGGGSRLLTKQISRDIQNNYGVAGVAHLTCVGATKENIGQILKELKADGVKKVLALRGDLPASEGLGDFKYASELIEFVNAAGDFEVFAACYPEGHAESCNHEQDLRIAKIKFDLGVKLFISQLFFDNADFCKMKADMRAAGITSPVYAGIMPLTNVKQILRIVTLSGAKLPRKLTKIVSKFENNPDALYKAGLDYAAEQIADLISHGMDGVHLYTMNNPEIAKFIHGKIWK